MDAICAAMASPQGEAYALVGLSLVCIMMLIHMTLYWDEF